MKIIMTTVYKFDELSDEAKQRAIEDFRNDEGYLSYDWWDGVYDVWTEKLEALGYEDIKIMFSGFWSQGDGACFTGSVDIPKYLKAHKLGNKYRTLLNFCNSGCDNGLIDIKHNGRYYHEHSMTADVRYQPQAEYYTDDEKIQEKIVDQYYALVEEHIDAEIVDLAKQIYSDLEDQYDYLMSDEAITEIIESNDYDFTKEGKLT